MDHFFLGKGSVCAYDERPVMQGIVDDALRKVETQGHRVTTVLVYDHKLAAKRENVPFTEGRDVWWQDAVSQQAPHCDIEWMAAEDPLFKVHCSCLLQQRLACCVPSFQAVDVMSSPCVRIPRRAGAAIVRAGCTRGPAAVQRPAASCRWRTAAPHTHACSCAALHQRVNGEAQGRGAHHRRLHGRCSHDL
jgi:hypothetical protein